MGDFNWAALAPFHLYKHKMNVVCDITRYSPVHKVSDIPGGISIGLLRVFPCVCSLSCSPHDKGCTAIVCHVDVSRGQACLETSEQKFTQASSARALTCSSVACSLCAGVWSHIM